MMIINLLKIWLYGLVFFLFISFIIPTNKFSKNAIIYIDVPYEKYQNKNIYHIYTKYDHNYHDKIQKWIHDNKYKNVCIVVPRFEFIIYYPEFLLYKKNHITIIMKADNLVIKNIVWKNIINNYHQTIWTLFYLFFSFITQNNKYV
jgi:hypothetical protein